MAKANKWNVQKMQINFNYKQWRQDFGAFVKDKLFWDSTTTVTKTRVVDTAKEFSIYYRYGEVVVRYKNERNVIFCSRKDIMDNYLKERSVFNG